MPMTTPYVPDDWSPQEALTVYEYLDQLRDRIWARYGPDIQEFCARDHITLHDNSQPDLFAPDDPLPF